MDASSDDNRKWYAVQTRSNMEKKAAESLRRQIDIEDMGAYISKDDILLPTETISEIKNGKKKVHTRNLYPGYIFVRVKLYDDDENFLEKPWYFVRGINGVINFMGGERPVALKQSEIERIFEQIDQSKGTEKPKVSFEVGEEVKINDGPFVSLTGRIDEIDPERGKLKVSVSIFGRFTPVELEYWQVARGEESGK